MHKMPEIVKPGSHVDATTLIPGEGGGTLTKMGSDKLKAFWRFLSWWHGHIGGPRSIGLPG